MYKHKPEELYERICTIRRRDSVGRDEACETLAKEMESATPGLRTIPLTWMLRRIESEYFKRRGFTNGGHSGRDDQPPFAPTPTPAADDEARGAGGQHSPDTHSRGAAPPRATDENAGGQPTTDTHSVPAASNSHGEPGGQLAVGTQEAHAPGTPWMKRAGFDWNAEMRLPKVGPKRAADVTKPDLRTASNVLIRSGNTTIKRGELYGAVADAMNDGETLREAYERHGTTLMRNKLKKLLAA